MKLMLFQIFCRLIVADQRVNRYIIRRRGIIRIVELRTYISAHINVATVAD